MFAVSLARLNKKIKKSAYLPVVKYADLEPKIFTVTRIQRLTNNFGPTIVIDLDGEYSLFLPKRTVESLSGVEGEEDFEFILAGIKQEAVGFQKTATGEHQFVGL